ncbi:Ig gamma-1 chain C region, membrane-bound form [Labeo rohita]|uniref:Ig gamma-1 chain C region, membrane-bound form n=1 Tax=Labeo rohita TaxID=84645 RepID=A0ABQ8MTS3_LABRO|nr:Ig gamma-1 chain C region, membrane-bound form [Labeo rohita]
MVTCTIRGTDNNRDVKQEIHFEKGDGQKPSVVIYKSDLIDNDRVSLVCEVTSSELGDVYIMWKVGDEPYIEGTTCAPIHQNNYMSVHSFLTMSEEKYERLKSNITCAVKHANMDHTGSPLQVSTSQITLTLKPPNKKELYLHNKVVLQAVVSGDVKKTVQDASVSCKVKDVTVTSGNITPGSVDFSTDASQFNRVHNVIIDTKKWFDGEMVTCTIRDTNNNRDVKQEIHFKKGDGQKPSVFIHKPDRIDKDCVSLVCEVTSSELGDVYIMWKVGDEPYIEGTTSAPIHQNNCTSVHSFLTMSEEKYERLKSTITCAVKHANMDHTGSPLQVSTSQAGAAFHIAEYGNRHTPAQSEFIRIHNVIIDTKKWFDGEMVTCTIRDTNNNRDVKQEIHFKKGDGQKPSVFIHKPDLIDKDRVSLVCEVTSSELGDVYIMWKVGDETYIEGTACAPIHQKNYTSVHSFLTMSEEKYERLKATITCAVKHANMDHTGSPLQVSTSQITLTLKPPNEKELFFHNKVVLQAVVSGDVKKTVQDVSVSCKVKDVTVTIGKITPGNVDFSTDASQFNRVHNVIIDTKKWFDGEMVTCTIRDTNNNTDINQKIHFKKGDGQKPSVFIHKPNLIDKDHVSLVCEVTSSELGDVYIMWKVGDEPYIEGTTSAPIHQNNYTSVLSFLTMSEEKYERLKATITCAVKHANMDHTRPPLQVSTSQITLTLKPPNEKELFVHNKVVLQAVVSGDVKNTVQDASVSCKVKDVTVTSGKITPGNVDFATDASQFKRVHNVIIDTKTWFDGEIVTCTIRDTNNRDVKQEIHFKKGDGQKPSVFIHKPDLIDNDRVSLVCEVTSSELGDVYIMWKVGDEPYIEGTTSAPIHQNNYTSVLSFLTMSEEKYERLKATITCAVQHANMDHTRPPLQVSTSQMKDKRVPNENITSGNVDFSTDASQFQKIHSVIIDTKTWFDGEIVTCTIRDTNNNRDVKQEIHFKKGDGQKPSVFIHKPDLISKDCVSLVCEVTSSELGDVYIMWKVGDEPYIEGTTSAPIHQNNYTSVLSFLTMSKEKYESLKTTITCAVKHANMDHTGPPLQASTSQITLTLKPPNEKELFVHNKVVLQAVVSGDVKKTVQDASVSCKVKDVTVTSGNITPGNVDFSTDASQFKRVHNVITDTKTWFDGETVTCTIRDTNNNRDIKQEIHFKKGDGQKPTVFIHKPDLIDKDRVSLVCEVTSSELGDVYIMWKVGDEPYIEGTTSAPIHQNNYTSVLSFLTMSKEKYEKATITCAVKHANMDHTGSPLQASTSQTTFTLTLKSPNERELFVNNTVVLEAVVSGDAQKTVKEALVSCKVKDVPITSENITPGDIVFSTNTSLFIKIHNVTIDTKKWFDGEMVTCTIRDTNNNRDIKQEIHFDKGDGKKPNVTIYKPDSIKDPVSHVCEVTSPKLGDVYIMWKVDEEPYIEGRTSARIYQEKSFSVLSILTMTKQEPEDHKTITCAVKHANMNNTESPLQVSTSPDESPDPENGFALDCNKDVLEEDEFRSLWSTATSFIFLFLFSLIYSAVLSFCKSIQKFNVTVSTKKWFDGEIVTCTTSDTNNNRDVKQEIQFKKGDGKTSTVTIYKPDSMDTETVSHVCEVTSPKLGDFYTTWKMGQPYIEGRTSAPIHQNNYMSALSILTMTQQEYEDLKTTITYAVSHLSQRMVLLWTEQNHLEVSGLLPPHSSSSSSFL